MHSRGNAVLVLSLAHINPPVYGELSGMGADTQCSDMTCVTGASTDFAVVPVPYSSLLLT